MSDISHILIVDKDESILIQLAARLEAAGYCVHSVASGKSALDILSNSDIHLLIADMLPTDLDFLSLLEQAKQKRATLPVLLLSHHMSSQQLALAKQSGVYGVLTKPIDNLQLFDLVNGALKSALTNKCDQWRENIIAQSPIMQQALEQAARVADSDVNLLIKGQTGSGKKLFAQAIHKASKRRDNPVISINCSMLYEHMQEAEMFGYVKNAFAGAMSDTSGLLAQAEGGTIILENVGDAPASLHQKLFRLIKDKTYSPIGSCVLLKADVRIISTTSRDLEQAILSDGFHEELYYHLNVVSLALPSLCDRAEDIPILSRHFMTVAAQQHNKKVRNISPGALHLLAQAAWPDNVKQLKSVITKVVSLSESPVVSEQLVAASLENQEMIIPSFDEARTEFERRYLTKLLRITEGNVTHAARIAERNRTDFYKLLKKHSIVASDYKVSHNAENSNNKSASQNARKAS